MPVCIDAHKRFGSPGRAFHISTSIAPRRTSHEETHRKNRPGRRIPDGSLRRILRGGFPGLPPDSASIRKHPRIPGGELPDAGMVQGRQVRHLRTLGAAVPARVRRLVRPEHVHPPRMAVQCPPSEVRRPEGVRVQGHHP